MKNEIPNILTEFFPAWECHLTPPMTIFSQKIQIFFRNAKEAQQKSKKTKQSKRSKKLKKRKKKTWENLFDD